MAKKKSRCSAPAPSQTSMPRAQPQITEEKKNICETEEENA